MNEHIFGRLFLAVALMLTFASTQAFCEISNIDKNYAIVKNALELNKEQDELAQLIFREMQTELCPLAEEYKIANAELLILEKEKFSKFTIFKQKNKIIKIEKKLDSCVDKYNNEFKRLLTRSQRLKLKRLSKNLDFC